MHYCECVLQINAKLSIYIYEIWYKKKEERSPYRTYKTTWEGHLCFLEWAFVMLSQAAMTLK